MELILRGDDAGSSLSANRAVEQCVRAGVLANVSLITVGPTSDDAARRVATLNDACVGLHVTLNSEFTFPRYRPLLPADRVPTLVGDDGCFLGTPADLHQRGFSLDEALAEVEAQLEWARANGLDVRYLDEHMGVGWLPGLADRLRELCRSERLVYARDVADALPTLSTRQAPGDQVDHWLLQLEQASRNPSGRPCVLITHPMFDDDEARAMHGPLHPPGSVARSRDLDRTSLLDPRFADGLGALGVDTVRYDELTSTRTQP